MHENKKGLLIALILYSLCMAALATIIYHPKAVLSDRHRFDRQTDDVLSRLDKTYYNDLVLWHVASYDHDSGTYYNMRNPAGDTHNSVQSESSKRPTFSTSNGGYLDYDNTSDIIESADHNDLSFTDGGGNDDPFSVMAWINPDTSYGIIVAKEEVAGVGQDAEWRLDLDTTGYPRLTMFSGYFANQIACTATATATNHNWWHITGTYDGSNDKSGITIYINGVDKSGSGSSAGSYVGMPNGTDPVSIGGGGDPYAVLYFDGSISDVKIFDVELASNAVYSIYASESGRY